MTESHGLELEDKIVSGKTILSRQARPMSPELQHEETPIDQAIVNELISLTPAWWSSAVLEVARDFDGQVERFRHVISTPDGHRDVVEASDELMALTHELSHLFHKHNAQWKKVTYHVQDRGGDAWKYTVDFEY